MAANQTAIYQAMINQILAPCPICGALPDVSEEGGGKIFITVECRSFTKDPGDRHFVKALGRTETEARAKWNRRPTFSLQTVAS